MKLQLTKIQTAISTAKDSLNLTQSSGKRTFLLDLSSSMNANDADQENWLKSRLDVLKDVIKDYPTENKIGFNDHAFIVGKYDDIQATGGTNLDIGLQFCLVKGYEHVILITDGHPTCAQQPIFDAVRRLVRLDIIYAGPAPTPQFLIDLANANNNVQHYDCSFKLPKQLTAAIKGLLGAPAKETIKL